jgi:hypothetical protein
MTASAEESEELQQKHMPFFAWAPLSVDWCRAPHD